MLSAGNEMKDVSTEAKVAVKLSRIALLTFKWFYI
jgi:hypothetical protein